MQAYRSSTWRSVTFRERIPPPTGVVSGPLIETRNSCMASTDSWGSQSLNLLNDFSPANTSIQAIRRFPSSARSTAASKTRTDARQISGPVPSPSTKGTIGLSGTFRLPFSKAILSPLAGTFASLYVAIQRPVGGPTLGAPNVVDAVRSDHTPFAAQASNSGDVRLVLRPELVHGRRLARCRRVGRRWNRPQRSDDRRGRRTAAHQGRNLVSHVTHGILQQCVHHWHHNQGEQSRGDQSADDRPGHRGALLCPGTDSQRQRHHAEHHRGRRHDDRPQTDSPRAEQRLEPLFPRTALLVGEVDEKNSVLRYKTHEHDDSDHGHYVDASLGDEKRDGDTNEAEWQRQHDRRGLEERAEQRSKNEVDENDGESERCEHVAFRLVEILHVTRKLRVVADRKSERVDRRLHVLRHISHCKPGQNTGGNGNLLLEITPLDLLGRETGLHGCHLHERNHRRLAARARYSRRNRDIGDIRRALPERIRIDDYDVVREPLLVLPPCRPLPGEQRSESSADAVDSKSGRPCLL